MEIFPAVWVESKTPFHVEVVCIYSLQKKKSSGLDGWEVIPGLSHQTIHLS